MYDDVRKDRLAWVTLAAACVAIFFTAFEVREPVLTAGPVNFTTTELAALFFVAVAAAWAVADRVDFFSLRALDIAMLIFLLSNFISVSAAADKAGALKFALRMTFAVLLYLGISRLPARGRAHIALAAASAVTLLVVVLIGLLQNFVSFIDWPYWLSPWQEGIFTFGAFYNIRISSTLPFPTSLAMYVELMLPMLMAAGLWLTSSRSRTVLGSRLLSAAFIVSIAGVAAVLTYTYTRSALVAMPAAMVAAAGLALVYGLGRRVVAYFILAAVLMGAIVVLNTVFSNKMASRLGVAEQVARYGAEYAILDFPPSVRPGEQYTAAMRLTNTSDVIWQAAGEERMVVGYRWFQGQRQQEAEGLPTFFDHDIKPGDTVVVNAVFATPEQPGQYILYLEMVQSGAGWFSSAHVPPATVVLDIGPEGSRMVTLPAEETDFIWSNPPLETPSRPVLWRAAYKMWKDHPLLGVGPDQFRMRYGEYMDELPDQRIRTNNVYLEALANTGIIGLLALLYMMAAAAWHQWRLIRDRSVERDRRLVAVALFAAMVSFAAHGLLDNFLWLTGIAFVFFAQLGLTSWMRHGQKTSSRA